MPKFEKGQLVIVVPRSMGAEVVEPDLPEGKVRVKFATVNPLNGETKIWQDEVFAKDLVPINKKKGVVII